MDRNGEIEGYSVRYVEEGSGEGDRREEMVSGDSSERMTTISGLTKETQCTQLKWQFCQSWDWTIQPSTHH